MSLDVTVRLTIGRQPHIHSFDARASVLDTLSAEFSSFMRNNAIQVEDGKGALTIPDDNPGAWQVLYAWKTEEDLSRYIGIDEEELHNPQEDGESYIMSLCHCWLLGERWDVPGFQDHMMRELLRVLYEKATTHEVLRLVFTTSTPNSKLCLLMCEEMVHSLRDPDDRDRRLYNIANDVGPLTEIEGLAASLAGILRAAAMDDDDFCEREKGTYMIGGGASH